MGLCFKTEQLFFKAYFLLAPANNHFENKLCFTLMKKLIASAKIPESESSISPSSFYG